MIMRRGPIKTENRRRGPRSSRPLTAGELRERARDAGSAREIIDLVRSVDPASRQGPGLSSLIETLMWNARRFNEDLGDEKSAVILWKEAFGLGSQDSRKRVVATMMSVARKRSDVSLPRESRSIFASVAIYEAVYGLNFSPEQNAHVVKTLMDVANRFTDLGGPLAGMDVEAAIALWESVLRLNVSEDDNQRVFRTMMDIANKLSDLRLEGGPRDVAGAIRIWQALFRLPVAENDRQRIILTMMALANRLSDCRVKGPAGRHEAAVRVWRAVYEMTAGRDEDSALRVVKTMMQVANFLTDTAGEAEAMDVEAAITIWKGVMEISRSEEDRERALRTMMDVASRLLGNASDGGRVLSALVVWHAAHRCAPSDLERLRVLKTVMDIGARDERACAGILAALEGEKGRSLDPAFHSPVKAGLLYYLKDFQGVIAMADAEPAPVKSVIALKADALRKLGLYDQSVGLCEKLILEESGKEGITPADRDALVSALCCRGYCFWEMGRADEKLLQRAEEDLKAAIDTAEKNSLPVPPRAWTGLGYLYQHQGREKEAEDAFARARQADPDNPKALEII
jgi:tetratricopeptide (TPR) repeat protein